MNLRQLSICAFLIGLLAASSPGGTPTTLNIWPGKPPGETKDLPPEADLTKDTDRLIAGKRIIKLGNVSTPQITVYKPEKSKDTGASVIICPGGGHNILAYDLEGTEVAQWLNTIGVTGIVLKYRVPFRNPEKRWSAAVADAQRAVSLVRSQAAQWNLDPGRIGICGFSAGGETAGLTSIFLESRQYTPMDDVDKVSCKPDFAILIYPGGFDTKGQAQIRETIKVAKETPPMFLVHAFDDPVTANNSLALAIELKKAGVSTELHIYDAGGHGYGLRQVNTLPVTTWPKRCEEWMERRGLLKKP
jgi:acetyl esterase/lipase